MSKVRSKDTRPEMAVRSALHRQGHRFRLHRRDLPGKPDVVLPRFRTAIFVHGCFWHGHDCKRGKLPASNREFWERKITANVARDERAIQALASAGWKAVTIWECGLKQGIHDLLGHLAASVPDKEPTR